MSIAFTRRACLAGTAAVALTGILPAAARAQKLPGPMDRIDDWFKILPRALQYWKVVPHKDDGLRVSLVPKDPPKGPLGKIMIFYPRKSTAYDIATTEILIAFHDKGIPATVEVVNFDRKTPRGNALVDEAERGGYALIFSMGSQSTAWLWKHRRNGKVPIVSVCSKDPVQLGQVKSYDRGSGVNFAFTSLNVLIGVQMAYLRTLKPKLRNIAILVDAKNISAVKTQALPLIEAARPEGIEAFQVAVQDPKKAREELAELIPRAIERMKKTDPGLENSLFWITGSTSVFVEIKTINDHAGKVPVLSVVPEIVQEGPDSAVLSIGVSFQSNAQLAAKYGADIVTGRIKAPRVKVGIVSPPNIAVSFMRAKAIGLQIPFSLFEAADYIYGYDGRPLRIAGRDLGQQAKAN